MPAKSLMVATVLGWLASPALSVRNVPPTMKGSLNYLGNVTDAAFGGFNFDDGAGGYINGYNLLTLSDASVNPSKGGGPVHTNLAYFGVSNASNPTELTIIANYNPSSFHLYGTQPGTGVLAGLINSVPSDPAQNASFAPAPNSALVTIGGSNKTGALATWNVFNYDKAGPLYNTLTEFNIVDPTTLNNEDSNVPAIRVVDKLFINGTTPLYGSAAMAVDSSYVYFLAQDGSGYKIARVPVGSHRDVNLYTFFNNATGVWSNTSAPIGDTAANIFNLPPANSGYYATDLFYSDYFETYLLTFDYSYDTDLSFGVTYSTSGAVTGPYAPFTDIGGLATMHNCSGQSLPFSDFAHSHPGWDPTGATLLISWAYCDLGANMGIITWE